jgi:enoyl-CoA hydratase
MPDGGVRFEPADGGVAVCTIDRPPVNALDPAAYLALAEVFEALAEPGDVHALVLTGAGERTFSAGTDTAVFGDRADYDAAIANGRRCFEALSRCAVPVVGAINAAAVGGGAMLAGECDVLLAAEGAYFAIPELSLGIPGGGSHVRRLAPFFKVQRMMLLGERLPAEEALGHGTLLRVVPRAQLLGAALEVARTLAQVDARAMRAARAILRAPVSEATLRGYHAELDAGSALVHERFRERA